MLPKTVNIFVIIIIIMIIVVVIVVTVITIIIVSKTKFSILIGSVRAYLLRNWRAITRVSNYNFL